MKKLINKATKNKLLTVLLILGTISIILGILFPAVITNDNKELIHESIKTFISGIKEEKINFISGFTTSITNNILVFFMIWILGISVIGIPLILGILFFKGFLVGFSFTSILITYGPAGIVKAIVYTLPNIMNALFSFLLCYYAISISIMIYKTIFKKETRAWQTIIRRYIKIGIFYIVFAIILSLIESYLIPKILIFC